MYEDKQRVEELKRRIDSLRHTLNFGEMEKKLEILTLESLDPNLWNNQEKARRTMQELSDLKNQIEEIKTVSENIEILVGIYLEGTEISMSKEINDIEKKLGKMELLSYLSGDHDAKDAIFSIHAGQGGTEAMDWTAMLFRMYTRYCEKKGYKTEVLESTDGEEAGIKSIIFRIMGNYAYGYLKNEAGAHRLVRQSPFNADKLRQTSFALVEVLPDLENVELPEIEIKDDDLTWQFIHSGGHGGQNVNKVATAVRLTHNPTGIVITAQTERFQEQNRKIALGLLKAKLWMLEKERAKNEKKDLKGDYKPASWGNQIRSYVLHPYKMVKDLRTEVESGDPDSVLSGELDEFIEEELKLK